MLVSFSSSTTTVKPTSLRDAVVGRIGDVMKLDGLEAAKKEFEAMKQMFSGVSDWHFIDKEVTDLFIAERKRERDEEAAQLHQLYLAWMQSLSKGANGGQLNLLTGSNSKAIFYTLIPPIIGGHK